MQTNEVEWEYFCDESYYHLWAVRKKSNTAWGECFHLRSEEEAKGLCELLNGQPAKSVPSEQTIYETLIQCGTTIGHGRPPGGGQVAIYPSDESYRKQAKALHALLSGDGKK